MSTVFENTVAVVTGAASGIGLGITEHLLRRGARGVFMGDFSEGPLMREAERLRQTYPERVFPVLTNVTEEKQVKTLIQSAEALEGHLDFVFNNAGAGATIPVEQTTFEIWKKVLDLNLMGVVYGTYTAIPIMRKQGFGHIVNTASLAGLLPIPYQPIYGASKSAIISMTESLQYELECEGLHFSVFCPSDIKTPIYGDLPPPPQAISVDEAITELLDAVEKRTLLIVLPESARALDQLYRTNRPAYDQMIRDMAAQRRENYKTKGTYY
ncbi:MAG: SDR family NAD(P)-dependent oxidoreductase [Kiritimatiellae bacterium]|nr:SDR family NAD(P)-dependent oxidoreductase [Kiritimatiellia bacterium]